MDQLHAIEFDYENRVETSAKTLHRVVVSPDGTNSNILKLFINGIPLSASNWATFGNSPGWNLDSLDGLGLRSILNRFEPDVIGMRMRHQHDISFDGLSAKSFDHVRIKGDARAFGRFKHKERLTEPAKFREFFVLGKGRI